MTRLISWDSMTGVLCHSSMRPVSAPCNRTILVREYEILRLLKLPRPPVLDYYSGFNLQTIRRDHIFPSLNIRVLRPDGRRAVVFVVNWNAVRAMKSIRRGL